MKERVGKIEFTIFDYNISIVVTDDIVKSRNNRSHLLGSLYHDHGGTKGLHSCNEDISGAYLFFNRDTTHEIIAHESFHAVYRMFKWIGAEIEEELMAYYLGYTVQQVTDFIYK